MLQESLASKDMVGVKEHHGPWLLFSAYAQWKDVTNMK